MERAEPCFLATDHTRPSAIGSWCYRDTATRMTESLPLAIGTGALALVGLVLCAEIAVRKLLALAAYLGLSSTFIGLTVFSVDHESA